MKIADRLIRALLVVMIMISLFLSYKIWTRSENTSELKDNSASGTLFQEKQPTEVFLPTKVIVHNQDNNGYSNRESQITNLQKQINQLKFRSLETNKSEQMVKKIKAKKNTIELIFPDSLPINYYEYINDFSLGSTKVTAGRSFNRIFIALKEQKIYFTNDQTGDVCSVEANGSDSWAAIKKLKNQPDITYTEVSLNHTVLPDVYYFDKPIELKKYSYILATQSYSTFTHAFFNDGNDLYSNDESDDTSLTNASGESLTIKESTGEVSYLGKLQTSKKEKENNIFGNTFQYVSRTGSVFGNIRYFSEDDGVVVYQNYVEGFPVFSEDNKSKIQMIVVKDNLRIQTNQTTIQVPIPSDETVLLKNTQDTINDLLNSGVKKEEIKDIQIGYTWEKDKENSQLVNLTPSWYVNYQGSWKSVEDFSRKE